jgi:hypothetical protein
MFKNVYLKKSIKSRLYNIIVNIANIFLRFKGGGVILKFIFIIPYIEIDLMFAIINFFIQIFLIYLLNLLHTKKTLY